MPWNINLEVPPLYKVCKRIQHKLMLTGKKPPTNKTNQPKKTPNQQQQQNLPKNCSRTISAENKEA